jgi:hypothetical protein
MVDRASDVEYGKSALATTPPEAAATTEVTMGRSQDEATDSGVCLCLENLHISGWEVLWTPDLHDEDHAEIYKDGHDDIDPPQSKGELGPAPTPWRANER